MKVKPTIACAFSLLVIAGTLAVASRSAQADLGHPVAIDQNGDSEVFVLSSDGKVRSFRRTGTGLTAIGEFPIDGFPVDFTYSVSAGQASFFVCSSAFGKGILTRYSTTGAIMNQWWLWHPCGGVDFDYVHHVLYTVTTDTNELYRIDITQKGAPQQVVELTGAAKLGPICVDAVRNRAYVSDVDQGNIYEVDISTKRVRSLTAGVGNAMALYLDPDTSSLYVVDAAGRRVLLISLALSGAPPGIRQQRSSVRVRGQQAGTPTVVAQPKEFVSPSGVVRLRNGQLLVSDYSADKIFVLGPSGAVIAAYP